MAVRAASQMKTSRIGVSSPNAFQPIRPYLGTQSEGVKFTLPRSPPAKLPQSFQQQLAQIAADEFDHLPLVLRR